MTGQKLRLLREFRNYSQEYIAEKLGITQHTYSRIENNQTKLTTGRLEQLAAILSIPPLELLSEKEPVIHFSDPPSQPAATAAPAQPCVEDHWREMTDNTRRLYEQVIGSKDERIGFLENEIRVLREEKNRIIRLAEKLAGARLSREWEPAV
jgi:transcriptional regulator with XRE-family HTH domain